MGVWEEAYVAYFKAVSHGWCGTEKSHDYL